MYERCSCHVMCILKLLFSFHTIICIILFIIYTEQNMQLLIIHVPMDFSRVYLYPVHPMDSDGQLLHPPYQLE